MPGLLTIAEARRLVLERALPLPPEPVPLAGAGGRVLVEDARAAVALPPFASSAMDGFAVCAADTPGTLPVAFRIAAGRPSPEPLARGTAMAIATGAVVPDGADAVVPVEVVAEHGNEVTVPDAEAGAHVRPAGGDAEAGAVVVPAGTRLGPAQLAALAAAGVTETRCGPAPRVAVLTTGTELRRPGEPLGPGQIYEANGILLAESLRRAGAAVDQLPSAADEEAAHREAIARGLEADVLVTSGGVSVGPHDLVRRIEAELGVEEVFWRVAVKPGKPVSFGVRGRTLVFGLPGNPVSALAGFELFVRPAVLALQGAADPFPEPLPGRLARAVRRSPDREQLLRARTRVAEDGEAVEVEPLTGQESHMIARAALADALVLVPTGDGELEAGSVVRWLPLG